jgi:membrane protein DedA with SNARE-associated domain
MIHITADLTGDLLINAADYAGHPVSRHGLMVSPLNAEPALPAAGYGARKITITMTQLSTATTIVVALLADIIDANIVYEPAKSLGRRALANLNNEATGAATRCCHPRRPSASAAARRQRFRR